MPPPPAFCQRNLCIQAIKGMYHTQVYSVACTTLSCACPSRMTSFVTMEMSCGGKGYVMRKTVPCQVYCLCLSHTHIYTHDSLSSPSRELRCTVLLRCEKSSPPSDYKTTCHSVSPPNMMNSDDFVSLSPFCFFFLMVSLRRIWVGLLLLSHTWQTGPGVGAVWLWHSEESLEELPTLEHTCFSSALTQRWPKPL